MNSSPALMRVAHHVLANALGSTIALTDPTGVMQTQYTYEPFGYATGTGAASSNPSQFTGRENDKATDLYYYWARYYDPTLQRFISEDPIGFAGGDVNLYAYAGNDPINLTDPSGERIIAPTPPGFELPPECRVPNLSGREPKNNFGGDLLRTFQCDPLINLFPMGMVGGRGGSLAQSLAKGLVKPGGKLFPILRGIEEGVAKAPPKSLNEALNIVGRATQQVGEGLGTIISQDVGGIVLNNGGNVTTTLKSTGEILIQRGNDILLHILP